MEVLKAVRMVNCGIDLSLIGIISAFFYTLLSMFLINYTLIFYITLFFYYFLFELFTAKTPGKMLTKTKVVTMTNEKFGVGRIAYRTLLRFNPFDAYSYLFGQEQGGHDLISRTRLIQAQNNN